MVPNDSRRIEPDLQAAVLEFLEFPANVNVVAGNLKSGVKSPYFLKAILAEGHVAARDVLGFFVGDQNMRRSTRRLRHAVGAPAVLTRRQIGTTDRGELFGQEALG